MDQVRFLSNIRFKIKLVFSNFKLYFTLLGVIITKQTKKRMSVKTIIFTTLHFLVYLIFSHTKSLGGGANPIFQF
jgi:hypothetical protein